MNDLSQSVVEALLNCGVLAELTLSDEPRNTAWIGPPSEEYTEPDIEGGGLLG